MWNVLTATYFSSQGIWGQKSQYGHIYMQSWNQKWTPVYKFSGTNLCHVVEWRHMLLRKCLPGDGSSKWNQYYLAFLAHPQRGCILSGICRSFFHSLKFFLQLLINLPWKHWCLNALLTSKNSIICLISCCSVPLISYHFHEGVLNHHYSCLLWLARLSLNLRIGCRSSMITCISPFCNHNSWKLSTRTKIMAGWETLAEWMERTMSLGLRKGDYNI